MDKIFDVRDAETNQYLGSVETESPFDAAVIHFAFEGIDPKEIQVNNDAPFEVTIENKRYTIIEDKDAKPLS